MAKKKEEAPVVNQNDLEAKFDQSTDKKDKPKIVFSGKKTFDIDKYKKLRSVEVEYKPDSYIPMSLAFQKVTGFPGFPQGYTHEIYGVSDVGKTTSLLELAVGAQKIGVLPVFVITEKKWSWKRAELMGINKDFCLFRDDFSFIEEACDFINSILEDQKNGNLPHDVVFLWDSVGSTPSRAEWDAQEEHQKAVQKALEAGDDMTELKKGSGGMMNAAKVLRERIARVISQKISSTRNINFPYYSTLFIVNHGYVSPSTMPGIPASLVAYGGGGLKYACSWVIRQGKVAGNPKKHSAIKNKVNVTWGLEVPFILEKNHINGISREGSIIVTPYGYIEATKEAIAKYVAEHRDEWDEDFVPPPNIDLETGEILDPEVE